MGMFKLGLNLAKKLVDTAKKVEKPKAKAKPKPTVAEQRNAAADEMFAKANRKPKPKLGGAGGRKFKDRVKKKPGSGKSLDDLMKEPDFQKALKSGELTLGKSKNKTGATRRKPKSPKDKLEDAVIVGGAIGTAAVLGKKARENKKTVKKAKGGMATKWQTKFSAAQKAAAAARAVKADAAAAAARAAHPKAVAATKAAAAATKAAEAATKAAAKVTAEITAKTKAKADAAASMEEPPSPSPDETPPPTPSPPSGKPPSDDIPPPQTPQKNRSAEGRVLHGRDARRRQQTPSMGTGTNSRKGKVTIEEIKDKAKGGMIKKAKGGMAKKTSAKKTSAKKTLDSFTPEEMAEAAKVIETFKRREKEKEKRRSKSSDPATPPKKTPGPQVFSKGGMAKKTTAKKTSAKKTSTRSKPRGVGAATRGYGRAMR